MNGAALIRTLRALAPELAVIAASGLHDRVRSEERDEPAQQATPRR